MTSVSFSVHLAQHF